MKKIGDRKDGKLIRDSHSLEKALININSKRTQNEVYMLEVLDLSKAKLYLDKKNATSKSHYSTFQFVAAVFAKTINLRPKLNNFIANKKAYSRNYMSVAFVVKKKFDDKSEEALAFIRYDGNDNIDTFHKLVDEKVNGLKEEKLNDSNSGVGFINKCPNFILRLVFPFVKFLERRGKLPASVSRDDPYYSSVFLANLGSVGLNAAHHHLSEWGTNSFFCVVGDVKKRPFYNEDGSYKMKDSVEIGFVMDERIADGYYFAKSLKLIRYLFKNPEELDKPFSAKVDYE